MRIKFFILLLASGIGIASCSSSKETTGEADSAMKSDADTTMIDTMKRDTAIRDTTGTGMRDTTRTGTTNPPKVN